MAETFYRLEGARAKSAPLILCLHGHGMNEDWFAQLLQRLFELPCHFLFPRASLALPEKNGRPAASWYEYDGDQPSFLRELRRVERNLLDLVSTVERERGLVPESRVVLGFSQGGYAGAYLALRQPEHFGGLIVSGARVKTEALTEEIQRAGRAGMRVLLCHGRRDRLVPPEAAERSHRELSAGGVTVTSQTFGSGHAIDRAQIAAISLWIQGTLVVTPNQT